MEKKYHLAKLQFENKNNKQLGEITRTSSISSSSSSSSSSLMNYYDDDNHMYQVQYNEIYLKKNYKQQSTNIE
ncbi:hypothetical protein DERF_013518 [Dermatophagoides farinae]|uniref:Uncharacterized protein n=1 Tax=Dermatophagoides farinae TaxID=6954 RepID=A0A922HRC2_DERFA|nr:hypothetical protein DERF_013518 [Dermatophagoides farinae]